MRWSFSSANSFENCHGGFKLTYIDAEERIGNAFSDYGSFVHLILEKYFKDELKLNELADFYQNNYNNYMFNNFPTYPEGMGANYFTSGKNFFEKFNFDKSLYDIIFIEDYINAKFNNILLTVKPDLILKEKSTGKYILIDYKTAKLKTGKAYKEQISEYKRQFLLYSYFLWTEKNIEIKQLKIWFIRDNKEITIDVDVAETMETMDWFETTIRHIKNEKEWKFNNSKENSYFCNNLCGVRNSCPMKN